MGRCKMQHIGCKTRHLALNLFDRFFVSAARHCRHPQYVALPAPVASADTDSGLKISVDEKVRRDHNFNHSLT